MRFFSSIKKSKFIVYASNRHLKDGIMPVREIVDFIYRHKDLSRVAREFKATRKDIENITTGMLGSPSSGVYRGHFTPVSSVFSADTLSYLLRSQRGQVSEDTAYMEVNNYFLSGDMLFEPEIRFRQDHLQSVHEAKGYAMGEKVKGIFSGR